MRSFNALNVFRSLPLTEVINVAAVTITVVRVIELKMVYAYLGWHVACLDELVFRRWNFQYYLWDSPLRQHVFN